MLIRPSRTAKAFTLLELIVVIVILGLLAALAIPTFARVTKKSQDAATSATLAAVLRDTRALVAFGDTTWEDAVTTAAKETSAPSATGLSAAALGVSVVDPARDPGTTAAGTAFLLGPSTTASARTGVVLSLQSPSGSICVGSVTTSSQVAPWCSSAAEAARLAPGSSGVLGAVLTGSVAAAPLPAGVTPVPAGVAPGAPTGVTVSVSGTTATLSFTPGAPGTAPVTYTATSSTGGLTGSATSSPVVVTGLAAASTYTFSITATSSAGTATSSPSAPVTTARVDSGPASGGAVDSAFSSVSASTPVSTAGYARGLSSTVDAQGRVLVGGTLSPNANSTAAADSALWRYNADGTLDTTWGTSGVVVSSLYTSRNDEFKSVKVDVDGNYLVVRYHLNAGCFVERWSPTGSQLASWAFPADFYDGVCANLAIDSQGRVLVSSNLSYKVRVARLTPSLVLDTTFGTGGFSAPASFPSGIGTTVGQKVAVDPSGRPVVAINTIPTAGGFSSVAALRFTAGGALDTAFGTNGWTESRNPGSGTGNQPVNVFVTADRIVIAGAYTSTSGAAYAFTSSGARDTTFGTNGQGVFQSFTGARMTQDSSGRLFSGNLRNGFFYASRLGADGVKDTTFGSNGSLTFVTDQGIFGEPVVAGSRILIPVSKGNTTGLLAIS
jgi:uncharacterized delta-60 repeat protein/prepilin-type N-terminal cleavage/methylation domain-containing protein